MLILVALALLAGALAWTLRTRSDFARERFAPGDRVRVDHGHHWARGATGTIRLPPLHVVGEADGWSGHVRRMPSARGELTHYWVEFDEPQRDIDGNGPYRGGEIEESYLAPP